MLKAWVETGDSGPVIFLAGEADQPGAGQLDTVIAWQMARDAPELTIDASRLRFADVASVRMLALAARMLTARGGKLVMLDPQPSVARVMALLQGDEHAASFQPLPPDPDPLEQLAPTIELTDPSPAQIRRVVIDLGHGQLPPAALRDLEISASEAVSNARRHGGAPVSARLWAAPGRILVHVHDTGPGPADPPAALVPAWAIQEFGQGGLWLIHMLELDIALIRSQNGFTVRLAAPPAD